MSADTSARYDGGVRLPSHCRFCRSEDMSGDSAWTNVNPHSHDGNHATVLSCNDCGGTHITFQTGNKRRTNAGSLTLTETRWEIPEGYCLMVCPECGVVIESRDLDDPDDRAFVKRFHDEPRHTACCDVEGVTVTGTYRRAGNGTPIVEEAE